MHPSLTQLTGEGNFVQSTDYRSLYASLLRDWWGFAGAQSEKVFGWEVRVDSVVCLGIFWQQLFAVILISFGLKANWNKSRSLICKIASRRRHFRRKRESRKVAGACGHECRPAYGTGWRPAFSEYVAR